MKGKDKNSVSAGIILIKKYQLKMFPLFLDNENLLIKKSMISPPTHYYLRLIQTV